MIDRTEAMTVVDVNTGKFTGAGGNLEETVTRNNLEAAEEIVRQMRLRDIGGMIVIDFIDMVLESNRDLVLRRLTESLGRDRTRHQVSEVTSLGLVQVTRKKLGTGLVEAFSTTCEHCHGRGIIVHTEPVETKSSDDGGRGQGQGKESGGGGRKKRGRDRAAAATPAPTPEPESNGQHAHPSAEEAAADATVKRAHPVALAMASHHSDHDPSDGPAAEEAAPAAEDATQTSPADVAQPDTVETPRTEPEATPEPQTTCGTDVRARTRTGGGAAPSTEPTGLPGRRPHRRRTAPSRGRCS